MKSTLIIAAFTLLWAGLVTAQVTETKLVADDGGGIDNFGNSVSVDRDHAIVGAVFNGSLGTLAGAAYVYKGELKGWTQTAKLLASDGASGDEFGHSVSIAVNFSGLQAVVGASHDNNDNGDDAGAAYIFDHTDTGWVEQAKIIPDDGSADDWFGVSVSLADHAIVGAPRDDDQGEDAGAAYIFSASGGGTEKWPQQEKLTAADAIAHDWFGISVCIDGDYAIVGADQEGLGPGKAYIFKRDTTGWKQQAKLTAGDAVTGHFFGRSVAIAGPYAIVGASGDNDNGVTSGAAYIFRRQGETWMQLDKLTASDGQANDAFGHSVSIAGEWAIVGAPMIWPGRNGAAYVFARNVNEYLEVNKLTASDGNDGDQFGWSVALTEFSALVGANRDDIGSHFDQGSAYAYFHFIPTEVGQNELVAEIPMDFALQQNYPNPFNAGTMIRYRLSTPSEVELSIYNLLGQRITTLVQENKPAGDHQIGWAGEDEVGRQLPSGVYFCRLETGGGLRLSKMLLLR